MNPRATQAPNVGRVVASMARRGRRRPCRTLAGAAMLLLAAGPGSFAAAGAGKPGRESAPTALRDVRGYTLALQPPLLALRDGRTEARLRLHARDHRGRAVDLRDRAVTFSSSDPELVSVDPHGVVRATGFGRAEVEARVAGLDGVALARIYAGRQRLEPPILYLTAEGAGTTGRLRLTITNADGSTADPALFPVTYGCTRCGNQATVTVDEDGRVHAHRVSTRVEGLAVAYARIEGSRDADTALVVVLSEPFARPPVELRGERVVFYTPETVGGVDVAGIWNRYDAVRVTDLAHELLTELHGFPSHEGQSVVLAHGIAQNSGMWFCGFASDPIWLGSWSQFGGLVRSCFIHRQSGAPGWGTFFHEMGHTFGGGRRYMQGFAMSRAKDDPYLSYYGEDFASIESAFVAEMLRRRARRYGLPRRIVRSVLEHWGTYWGDTQTLDGYVAAGADYRGIPGGPGGIFRGMMWKLSTEYGWGALYRLFSMFLPVEAEFSFAARGVEDRATFFAAAWSAATGDDLRRRFRDEWGFPIDDSLYRRMLKEMVPAARLRDPVVDAGPDRGAAVGETVLIAGARADDWEGDSLRYRWTVAEGPPGGRWTLTRRRRLDARFTADSPGDYVLRLEAGDDLVSGSDSVRVRVSGGP